MPRLLFIVLLLLFNSTMALEQETTSATTERESPCTLHPVRGRICVNEKVLYGFLVKRVAPNLPDAANVNSEVVLHLIVSKNGGKPARISVISGDPALARLTVRAVKQWIFKPYIYNGQCVAMESNIHLRFPDPN
jgi:outer membrane biosynthesis protein TonB